MRRLILMAAVLAWPIGCAAQVARVQSIQPWVEVADGTPAACGVRFMIEIDGDEFEVGLRLEKRSAGLDLVLSGRSVKGQSRFAGPVAITTARQDSRALFPDATPSTPRWVVRRAAESGDIGPFLQELMIGGGTISLNTGSFTVIAAVPGPLPQAVRASYLNCAGDLYRPSVQNQ